MSKRLTTNEFIDRAIKVHGDKYDYTNVIYSTSHTKVKIKCQKHCIFEQIPNAHLKGQGCPLCYKSTKRKSTSQFITEAISVHGNRYDYTKTLYTTASSKIIITCPIHGDFYQDPSSHLRHKGCPKCNMSKGEAQIERFCIENDLQFIHEYTINIKTYDNDVRFDFYLPTLNVMIEYDGKQHFEPVDHFGGEPYFIETSNRDKLKNEYCKTNGINLIRIPYWEFLNIHSILSEFTSNLIDATEMSS